MSNNSTSTDGGGIGVLGLLGVVFVTLKLLKVISWSWWLVLLPFYGPLAVGLGIIFVGLLIAMVISLFK